MAGMQKHEIVVRNAAGDLEVIDLHTGEVVSNSRAAMAHTYAFSFDKAIYICHRIREGATLQQIANEPDMPPIQVISHWQRTDRMFAEEIKRARTERGEHYFDKAMTIAQKAENREYGKDDVPAAALAAKLYQWGAEKSKPESYGAKVTHEGSEVKPILMRVINTGISRPVRPDVEVSAAKPIEVLDVTATKQQTDNESGREDEED